MRPALLLIAPFLAGLLVVLGLALRHSAPMSADAAPRVATVVQPATASTSVVAFAPASAGRPAFSPEDVFRRAFWRHPTPADHIVEAERKESAGPGGEIASWRWFIAVHPGPDLLAALRSPGTFGLRRVDVVEPVTAAPAWFPATPAPDTIEMLQAPAGLTVLYRAKDNLLFATDQGAGFARPARPL